MNYLMRGHNLLLSIFFIALVFGCEKKIDPIVDPNPTTEWQYKGFMNTYHRDYYPQSDSVYEVLDTFKCQFVVNIDNDSVYFTQYRMDTLYQTYAFLVSDSSGNKNTYYMGTYRPNKYIKWTQDSLVYFNSWAAPVGPQALRESFEAALEN